jgi:hypothetical protein
MIAEVESAVGKITENVPLVEVLSPPKANTATAVFAVLL